MTDSKNLSRERYTRYADGYITSQTHAKGSDLDRLIEVTQPQADWVVLDVATGGGHTALKFAPYVQRVVATDLTPNMLRKAEAHLKEKGADHVEFKVVDAEDLTFADEVFDLVTCRIAAHHFPEVFKFVQEAARVLKPGGLLLVQDHVLPDDERDACYVDAFEKLRDPSHNRAFAEYEWRGMFLDAGLSVEHTEQLVKRHDFIEWAERQGCTPETIERLVVLLKQAPEAAAEWMDATCIGTSEATFVNHHIIILGCKSK